MVADNLLAEVEGAGGEIAVILRKMLAKRHAEAGLVARRRHLRRVGQAVGVAIGRAGHAECTGFGGHHSGKAVFRAADIFAERGCHVICRTGDECKDGLFHGDAAAGAHAQLGRRLLGCIGRDRHLGIKRDASGIECFERQVKRHHLRQRGWITQAVRILTIEDLAGLGVDDDTRIFRVGLCGLNGCCGYERRSKG
ncbi:hypothetical protein D3C72_978860 [compost metagenome]